MPQEYLADSPTKAEAKVESSELRQASAEVTQGGLHPILQLQRTRGNRFVAQWIKTGRLTPGGKTIGVLRKAGVDAAGDQYEQAVDRVARQAMSTPDAGAANATRRTMFPEKDKDQMLQTESLAASIAPQNARSEDAEKTVQARLFIETSKGPLKQRNEAEKQVSSDKLPSDVEADMEASFDADFSGVNWSPKNGRHEVC